MSSEFKFLDPGELIDNELSLVLVEKVPADTDRGYVPDYKFKMINTKTGEEIGNIDLRIGFNENIKYGGNSGYGVHEKFRGNNYAARSLKLLLPFAKENGMEDMWVMCDPKNIASRKTCEKAGGTLVDIVDIPEDNEQYKRGDRQNCRYKFALNNL